MSLASTKPGRLSPGRRGLVSKSAWHNMYPEDSASPWQGRCSPSQHATFLH